MLLYSATFQLMQEVYQSRRGKNVASVGGFLRSTVTNPTVTLDDKKVLPCNFCILCKNYFLKKYVFFKKFKM